jgi:hypothetical protein
MVLVMNEKKISSKDEKRLKEYFGVMDENKKDDFVTLSAFPGIKFSKSEADSLFVEKKDEPIFKELSLEYQKELARKVFRVEIDEKE